MRDLSRDDDFISHLLVEKLGTGAVPLVVHKMDPTRKLPKTDADKLMQIVRRLVASKRARQKAIEDAVDELLNQSPVRYYLRDYTQKQINAFATHASRYFELYLPTGSIEIAHTSRYSHRTGKSELCILATRPLIVGAVITELKGSMADLTEEEDKELKRTDEGQQEGGIGIRRDFSVIHSKQLKKNHLFLGPARFVNHDCDHNVELFREGRYITFRVIKPIAVGEEVTAHYGDGYFGKKNRHCLCQTCERKGRGGYGPETSSDDEEEDGSDDATGAGVGAGATSASGSHLHSGGHRRHRTPSRSVSDAEDDEDEGRESSEEEGEEGNANLNERRTRRGIYAVLPDDLTEAGTAAMELDVEAEVDVEVDAEGEDGSRGGPSKPNSRIGNTNGTGLMTPDPDPPAHGKTTAISRGRTRERGSKPAIAVARSSGHAPNGIQPASVLSRSTYLDREGSLETSSSSRLPSRSSRARSKGKGRRKDAERSVTPDEFTKLRRNPHQHQLVTPDNSTNASASTPSASNSVRSSSRVRTNAMRGNGGGTTTEGSRLSTPARDHPLQYLQHQLPQSQIQPQTSSQLLQGGSKGKGRATGSTSVVSDLREEREASAERGESSSRSLRPRTTHVSYTYSLLDPSHPNHPLNHQAREHANTTGACGSGACNHPHHHHIHSGNTYGRVDIGAPRGLDGKPLPTCLTCGSVLPVISVDEQVVWGIWGSQKTGKRGRPKKEKTVEME